MKPLISLFAFLLLLTTTFSSNAQDLSELETVAVLHIDAEGFTIDPVQMGNITRVELSKLDRFQMMDKYDVSYLIEKNELKIENCYGKLCLVEIGKVLKVDKMLTGSVELYQDVIVITMRLIDVGSGKIVDTKVMEFLNIRNQIQTMIGITLKEMFDLPVDENLLTKLTKEFDYESSINMPEVDRLNLDGPRMGVTFFSGETAEVIKAGEASGGYDGTPVMFQFGYQFEIKYLNQGNFQALFEFIPIVTGLDQGRFIPSVSVLNGMRHNQSGFEFAFGPNLAMTKKADGFFDANNVWHLEEDWVAENPDTPNPYVIEKRIDSRGEYHIATGFLFGIGKTFRSGRLNIPINAFFIPGKDDSHRFGISMGYNASQYAR